MLTMFAEVCQDGEWRKVGKEFISTYEELEGQLTDRVYDGYDEQLIDFLVDQSGDRIPSDVGEEIKNHHRFQENDVYHATLRELLGFEWDKSIHKTGYISEWQYGRLQGDGIKPVGILSTPTRKDALIVRPFEMDLIMRHPVLKNGYSKIYVIYEYDEQRYRDMFEFFCNISIPRLIKLIPNEGTADDVRVIFSVQ